MEQEHWEAARICVIAKMLIATQFLKWKKNLNIDIYLWLSCVVLQAGLLWLCFLDYGEKNFQFLKNVIVQKENKNTNKMFSPMCDFFLLKQICNSNVAVNMDWCGIYVSFDLQSMMCFKKS